MSRTTFVLTAACTIPLLQHIKTVVAHQNDAILTLSTDTVDHGVMLMRKRVFVPASMIANPPSDQQDVDNDL